MRLLFIDGKEQGLVETIIKGCQQQRDKHKNTPATLTLKILSVKYDYKIHNKCWYWRLGQIIDQWLIPDFLRSFAFIQQDSVD